MKQWSVHHIEVCDICIFFPALLLSFPNQSKLFQNQICSGFSVWPGIVFTDRGGGFYDTATGYMTNEYRDALASNGLTAFAGEDARIQPGHLQEVMLHETAVAWIRYRLAKTVPPKPWEETEEQYAKRLKECVAYINEYYNVKELCMEFPQRVARIMEAEGGRIGK